MPSSPRSAGLLVATDPDTPYLHVGLNCPPPRRSWLSGGVKKISWGVGIQASPQIPLPPEPSPAAPSSHCCRPAKHCSRISGLPSLFRLFPQNFTRQILPLEDVKGRGDGMLRLQARGNFESRRISHPLEVWETPVEFGHEVPASLHPDQPREEPQQDQKRSWAYRDGHVLCAGPVT